MWVYNMRGSKAVFEFSKHAPDQLCDKRHMLPYTIFGEGFWNILMQETIPFDTFCIIDVDNGLHHASESGVRVVIGLSLPIKSRIPAVWVQWDQINNDSATSWVALCNMWVSLEQGWDFPCMLKCWLKGTDSCSSDPYLDSGNEGTWKLSWTLNVWF